MRIIDYEIIQAAIYVDLEQAVKQKIREGWQPQGGGWSTVVSDEARHYVNHYQAVVLYED